MITAAFTNLNKVYKKFRTFLEVGIEASRKFFDLI